MLQLDRLYSRHKRHQVTCVLWSVRWTGYVISVRILILAGVNADADVTSNTDTRAVLSQGEPRDAAVNFDRYQILQRHRAVSLPQHGFLV